MEVAGWRAGWPYGLFVRQVAEDLRASRGDDRCGGHSRFSIGDMAKRYEPTGRTCADCGKPITYEVLITEVHGAAPIEMRYGPDCWTDTCEGKHQHDDASGRPS